MMRGRGIIRVAVKINDILAHFDRTADQYISRDDFKKKLRLGRPLRIKYGVDVRTPTLHIGHAVNLWLMRYLQDQGHKVVFVIGDFTTRIGEPDGRLDTCEDIAPDEVEANIETFLKQARMVLRFDDPKLIEVRRNSEWYGKMSMREFMDVASLITHARLMARDMFQMRMAQGREIYLQEMLYPVLQAYDSLVVESDLAIVGSDQLFNESLARLLQEKHGKPPQALLTTKITPGTDGKGKQSKSLGNYIGLLHSPRDKFGRIMSIPDGLIEEYFRIYTDVPYSEISGFKTMAGKKPRDAKMALASALVERYHGHQVAEEERDWFEKTFSRGELPEDMPTLGLVSGNIEALDLVVLARPGKSKSDSRRLIVQGAVELNGKKLTDPAAQLNVKTNDILKAGKRNWFRLEIVEVANLETGNLILSQLMVEDVDFLAQYVPVWELVKHLGMDREFKEASGDKKLLKKKARELLKKGILKPEPKDEWLWKVARKDDPETAIGVARLGRVPGWTAEQKVWIRPEELQSEEFILTEALYAINEYAFTMLGMNTLAFKNAFAYATAPKELDTLRRAMINMDSGQLNREDAMGTMGFTKDGWQMMQQWRRTMSPWLFQNSPKALGAPAEYKFAEPDKDAKDKKPAAAAPKLDTLKPELKPGEPKPDALDPDAPENAGSLVKKLTGLRKDLERAKITKNPGFEPVPPKPDADVKKPKKPSIKNPFLITPQTPRPGGPEDE